MGGSPENGSRKAVTVSELERDKSLPNVVSDVTWSCPEKTMDDTGVEITTFQNDDSGRGKPSALPQNENAAVQYRFDGVALARPALLIHRQYANSVVLHVADLTTRPNYIDRGLVTLKKANSYEIPESAKFYIVDPDFVVRVPTSIGEETLEFSLTDPSIQRVLTACGFTYGQPPSGRLSDK